MENTAKINGMNMEISAKQAVEIAKLIKYKSIKKSMSILQNVLDMKEAVPMRKYNRDTGHKTGIGPGRYPQKASKAVFKLLGSLEANAVKKGLNADSLIITKAIANRASRPWHTGRHRGRKMRRAHLYLEAAEMKNQTKPEQSQPKK